MDEHLHNDSLEDFFRHSLDNFGDEPSDDVWSNLDKRLALHESGAAAEGVTSPTIPSTPSIMGTSIIKWVSLATIITFLGVFTYYIYQQNSEIANLSEHIDQQTQTIEQLNDKVDNLQKEDFKTSTFQEQNNTLQQANIIEESKIVGSKPSINQQQNNTLHQANTIEESKVADSKPSINQQQNNTLQQANTIEESKIVDSKPSMFQEQNNTLQQANTIEESKVVDSEPLINEEENNALQQTNTIEGSKIADSKQKPNFDNKLQEEDSEPSINQQQNNTFQQASTIEGSKIADSKQKLNFDNKLQEEGSKPSINEEENNTLQQTNTIEGNKIADSKQKPNFDNKLQEEEFEPSINQQQNNTLQQTNTIEENEVETLKTESKKGKNNSKEKKVKQKKTNNSSIKKGKKTKPTKKKVSKPEGALADEVSPPKEEEEAEVGNNDLLEETQTTEIVENAVLPKNPNLKAGKWSIAAVFAPTYSFRRVKSIQSKDIAKNLNSKEKAAFSYDAGVEIAYQFSKKWSVKSGIQYRQIQQKSNLNLSLSCHRPNGGGGNPNPGQNTFECKANAIKGSFGKIDIDFELKTNAPIKDGDKVDLTVEHKQTLNWLRLPLLVQHSMGNGRLKTSITGGLAANFLLTDTPKYKLIRSRDGRFQHRGTKPQNTPEPSPKISKSHLEYVVGLGMSYQAKNNLQLFVEPTYSAALKPIFENKDIQTTPFSFSGNIGVRVSF